MKHGEEWGEPSNCDAGDGCGYCHTRTEQQFHPEIYKSTKCNDVQQAGYCPRGLFCAFAHVEPDELAAREADRDAGTSLADLLCSALPQDKKADLPASPPAHVAHSAHTTHARHTNGDVECAPPSPAPPPSNAWTRRAAAFDATVLQEVVGNALDDMRMDEPRALISTLDRELLDGEPSALSAPSASQPLPPPSAPVSIPRFSPPGGYFSGYECSPREVSRLRDELAGARAAVVSWDDHMAAARSACEVWRREADEATRALAVAERQRDDALVQAAQLQRELDTSRALTTRTWRDLSLPALKALQARARADLDDIEKTLYLETATKCMRCEERARAVTLAPCNHYVLCEPCADSHHECPYCQGPTH